jgi:hypothetical protein
MFPICPLLRPLSSIHLCLLVTPPVKFPQQRGNL